MTNYLNVGYFNLQKRKPFNEMLRKIGAFIMTLLSKIIIISHSSSISTILLYYWYVCGRESGGGRHGAQCIIVTNTALIMFEVV